MYDDVIGPAVLCVQREIENRVKILIRHRNNNAGLTSTLFDSKLEVALALSETHREELALLPGDEQSLDIEVIDPVTNIRAEARFIQRKVFVKGIQRGRPDPAQVLASMIFCF